MAGFGANTNWADALAILGATLRDAGAANSGGRGDALQMLSAAQEAKRKEKKDREDYERLISGLSGQDLAPPLSGGAGGFVMPTPVQRQPLPAPAPGMDEPLWKRASYEMNNPQQRQAEIMPPMMQSGQRPAQSMLSKIGLDPQMLQRLGPDFGMKLLAQRLGSQEKEQQPLTDFGKINTAVQRGEIGEDEANILKERITRPDRTNPPAPVATAMALGLKPGSKEFSDYIRAVTMPQAPAPREDQTLSGWGVYADPTAGVQFRHNTRTGQSVTLDGKPYTPKSMSLLSQDPFATFGAASGRVSGQVSGQAAAQLPQGEVSYRNAMKVIDDFDKPEVKAQAPYALGVGGILPPIPGVNTDFVARARQLQGIAFLQAYQTLKGGGVITEIEGTKATEAQARLNRAQTVQEYYAALADAKALMTDAWEAQKTVAGRGATAPQMRSGASPALPDPLGLR